MNVKVLFFGATAALIGSRRLEFPIDGENSAASVFERVIAKYPELRRHKLLFSINQEYADLETIVREGDELAIFTAVSGG